MSAKESEMLNGGRRIFNPHEVKTANHWDFMHKLIPHITHILVLTKNPVTPNPWDCFNDSTNAKNPPLT